LTCINDAIASSAIYLLALDYQYFGSIMNPLIRTLVRLGLLTEDLDYRLIRASLVIIFLFFGYTKWFEYAARLMVPFISHGPLIFWLYPVFGFRGASRFLGATEWLICALLFCGFWNKRLGIFGAIGATITFISTITIIPFLPDGWAASAGGFPAMSGDVPFLMKDLALLAASIYLLKQDVSRIWDTTHCAADEAISMPQGVRRSH
jgi:uncharacterized membrane protein YkgB